MVFLTFLLSPVGRALGIAAIALALVAGIYMKGHSDGSASVQRKWDAAVQAAIDDAKKARSDAERDIDADPNGVRDPENRDKP